MGVPWPIVAVLATVLVLPLAVAWGVRALVRRRGRAAAEAWRRFAQSSSAMTFDGTECQPSLSFDAGNGAGRVFAELRRRSWGDGLFVRWETTLQIATPRGWPVPLELYGRGAISEIIAFRNRIEVEETLDDAVLVRNGGEGATGAARALFSVPESRARVRAAFEAAPSLFVRGGEVRMRTSGLPHPEDVDAMRCQAHVLYDALAGLVESASYSP